MVRDKQQGFSMVELLVVIAIIGIVVSITVLKINQSMAQRDLDNAARQLAGDIRLLEQMGLNSNDGGGLPTMTFSNGKPFGYLITGQRLVTFPNITSYGNAMLSVGIDGKPSIGITITLLGSSGKFKQVFVEQLTGRVRTQ